MVDGISMEIRKRKCQKLYDKTLKIKINTFLDRVGALKLSNIQKESDLFSSIKNMVNNNGQ